MSPIVLFQLIFRAGPRLRPIRPLPRAPYWRRPQIWGQIYLFFIYKYFWEILKHFSLFFFSLLRRLKELSNARDRNKTNLNKA